MADHAPEAQEVVAGAGPAGSGPISAIFAFFRLPISPTVRSGQPGSHPYPIGSVCHHSLLDSVRYSAGRREIMPRRNGYTQGEPCWADLSAEDTEGAKAFYGALFGWTWEDRGMPDSDITYSMAQKDGCNVAGLGPAPPELLAMGLRSVWNTYLAVDSADEAYRKAIEAGGKGLAEPFDVMTTGRMAYIMDNQGAAVGFWQAGDHRGAQLIKEPGTMSWSELYVPDVGAATQFLGDVLGLTAETSDMGPMSYTLLKAGDEIVAGAMEPPENVPPSWSVYFGAADIDATAGRVAELGGQVINGPFPTPLGQMIVAADTAGGVFLVHDYSTTADC